MKQWIIPDPVVMFVPLAKEDDCLILASDGLWDVMNKEACDVARRRILLWYKKHGNTMPAELILQLKLQQNTLRSLLCTKEVKPISL